MLTFECEYVDMIANRKRVIKSYALFACLIERFINRKILLSYIGEKQITKMEITKISSKGQIVIPLKIRNQLGISEGSVIAVDTTNKMIVLKKIDVDLVKQFKESLADVKAGRIKRVA